MVRAHHVWEYHAFFDMLPKRLRGTEIIDPPAHILFSSIEHVAPPSVMAGVFGEQAERV